MEAVMKAPAEKRLEANLRAWRARGFDCLCGNVRMASRALTSLYDAHLAPAGITSAQLPVLWAVIAAEPLSMREIADWLVMDKTTVSRNVAALESMGLLGLQPGPDARVKLASSTAKGRKAFSRAIPLWKAAQLEVEKKVGRESFAQAVLGARKLARKVQGSGGERGAAR
jgi:DNA-binding MarR family transcriptional regulator